jgi:hypothetical protein
LRAKSRALARAVLGTSLWLFSVCWYPNNVIDDTR